MSDIFLKDAKHMFGNLFITITQVRVSPDLGLAKIYLSLMMTNDKDASLELIRSQTKPLRKLLGDKIRKQARIIPELAFFLDDSVDYAMHIESIMSKLDIPKDAEEGKDKPQKK
ncbi:MAG: ribosome-binding factor A [Cytophagaceae bacterium]|nr:ribosome-binding factor A [Cytophagaceae bacterium]